MSRDKLPIILSPKAEEDFADILQYTFQTWCEKQMYVYRAVIDKALLTIQQNPDIGHQRPEISKAIGHFLLDSMSFFIDLTSLQFMFHAYCMNEWILKARSEPLQHLSLC